MSPAGRVRLSLIPAARIAEGPLVDVSAGGLCLAAEDLLPAEGARVRIEIRLDAPRTPGSPPRLVLDGVGRVAWVRPRLGEPPLAGIAFDEPVRVRPPFPEVRVF